MLILHLSDIHFRKGEVNTAMDPNAHLRAELVRDAEDRCRAIGRAPDAILFSGDIAFGGDPAEYAFAVAWLEELSRRCGTTMAAVFAIPGNHDVVRNIAGRRLIQTIHRDIKAAGSVTLESMLRGLLTDPETARLLYEALGPYNQFASQFFCDLLPPERTMAKRDLSLNDGSILRLSGFNSAFVSSAADKAGDLFVDPACFQLQKERGVEHLVACHHPYSWLRQGDALKDFLDDVARIQLFGHEHTNRIEIGRDWVRVAASAAHPDKTERGWEPGYNLLELNITSNGAKRVMNVGVHVRVWQSRPGQFRAKMDHANDVFRQSIELDDWTPPPSPIHANVDEVEVQPKTTESVRIDPMDSLRDIGVRFFKLTLSQKSAIAGKLNLLEDTDANLPDFERFRRAFVRARERGLVEDLDREVKAAASEGH
jgi:hypothetical protein